MKTRVKSKIIILIVVILVAVILGYLLPRVSIYYREIGFSDSTKNMSRINIDIVDSIQNNSIVLSDIKLFLPNSYIIDEKPDIEETEIATILYGSDHKIEVFDNDKHMNLTNEIYTEEEKPMYLNSLSRNEYKLNLLATEWNKPSLFQSRYDLLVDCNHYSNLAKYFFMYGELYSSYRKGKYSFGIIMKATNTVDEYSKVSIFIYNNENNYKLVAHIVISKDNILKEDIEVILNSINILKE